MASQHRAQEPFELPKIENNDLFKKSLALLKRCQSLTQCLVELINVPFPQAKFILPGLVANILDYSNDRLGLTDLFNFRVFSILLSFVSISWTAVRIRLVLLKIT